MLSKTSRTLLAAALVAGGAGAALTPAAHAAYPGANGQIVFSKELGDGLYRLHLAKADGTDVRELTETFGIDAHPAWSPDGTRIVYQHGGSASEPFELRIIEPATKVDVPLGTLGDNPTWSPDGTKLAYEWDGDIWVRSADATNMDAPTLLTPGDHTTDSDPAWSSTDRIAFVRREGGGDRDVWTMPTTGDVDGAATRVSTGDEQDLSPDWSPDGSKIAYVRDGIHDSEIVVQAPGGDATELHPDPTVLDDDPAWSPDGTRIVWRSTRAWADMGGNRLWTADPADELTPPLALGTTDADPSGIDGLQPDWQPIAKTPQEPQPKPEDPKDDPKPEPPPAPQQPAAPQQPEIQQRPVQATAPSKTTPRTAVTTAKRCVSRRRFRITLPSKGRKVTGATVTVAGKKIPVTIGKRGTATVDLRTQPKGTFTVEITVTTTGGTITQTRRYKTCAPKKRA
ncbi:MAG TPA: hypothetical protein VN238_15850 [Solirubrobacteraceae bacterium]|nr:hypothetical protein [Solirubrobacteraceae bacterium]